MVCMPTVCDNSLCMKLIVIVANWKLFDLTVEVVVAHVDQ